MASDLLQIGISGAKAARGALEVTAQNIANAATEGYVRRSVRTAEVSAAGGLMRTGDISLSGVRIAGLERNADSFRQAEVRRTGSDAARGAAELQGLENIESAIEQSRTFDLVVEFEAALRELSADPTDPSLRAASIAAAGNMASGFTIAAQSLDAVGTGLQFEAAAEIDETNLLTGELARVNLRIARTGDGSSDRATLLDQRDNVLERLATRADVAASFDGAGRVEVTLGGELLVQGGTAIPLTATTAADGTLDFALGGTPIALNGGSLSGKALALDSAATRRSELDTLAAGIITTVNTAQANGAALDGSPGLPLLSGTAAADIALAFENGALLATAPAGSPAGSTDGANLAAWRQAFESGGFAQGVSNLLFAVSSEVSGKQITSEALGAIASAARIALDQQSGVDLDQEAANLVRYQQAFQASGRAMQVASDIFDTLLGIG